MSLAHDLRPDQEHTAAQTGIVGPAHLDTGHSFHEAHPKFAGAIPPPDPNEVAMPRGAEGRADALLLLYADALDDLERVRIATENRVRSLVQVKGMEGTPEQARLAGLTDALRALEHGAELELKRALRTHPLGPWVKATVGVGEKQGARLLAAIGNPAERRTVSQLWAYCGYHVLHPGHPAFGAHSHGAGMDPSSNPESAGVAPVRRKGVKANWNATARMRAFLVAGSCIKQAASPYRAVYDAGRTKYADSIHKAPCVRCAPAGTPAEVGSPLSAGHQHARALRLVAKAVLRDLWIEARRVA